MTERIAPCPRCGGRALVVGSFLPFGGDRRGKRVRCQHCGHTTGLHWGKAAATAEWNGLVEAIEELKAS